MAEIGDPIRRRVLPGNPVPVEQPVKQPEKQPEKIP